MNDQNPSSPELIETVDTLWGVERQPAGCSNCRQAFLIPPDEIGKRCPNCGKSELQSQPARLRPEPPELLLPFKIQKLELTTALQAFTKGVWLHADDFSPQTLLQRVTPSYLPMWLIDSDVAGDWQAEVGYDYQVKSSRDSYVGSQWRTQEVIKTRIRWESRLGLMNRHYDNIAVPAMSDHDVFMSLSRGYQTNLAIPYSPKNLGKSSMRIPDLQPENAWPLAKANLNKAAAEECRQASEAHHARNFAIHANYSNQNWTQLLLPIYTTYYIDDNGEPQMVYINAQSGVVGGRRLASQRKGWVWAGIIAAVAVALFLLGALFLVLGAVVPPFAVLGPILMVLALLVGIIAVIPAVWPWQWNRKQQEQRVTRS